MVDEYQTFSKEANKSKMSWRREVDRALDPRDGRCL
jgi:hypothetical protein